MRTLNRPMFRMGGPIKQGIMHGIREPRRGGGRAALVGNPIFPQDASGRAHHSVWGTIFGAGSKVLPRAGGIMSRAWNKIKPTGKFREVPVPKGYPTKDIAGQVGSRFNVKGKGFQGPAPYTAWETLKQPKLWWKGAKENPYWTAGGAIYGGPAAGELGVKAATGPGWSLVKQAADLAVPDWIWDQDKWEAERAARKELEKNLDINRVTQGKAKGVPGGGVAAMTYTDPEKAKKLAAKRKDERVNSLLDIMGYDKAKKTAAYDALIDASQIVMDRGTLNKKNIGRELINPIIAATSKRFDKPEQIREAVGLLAAKGEIEKDIAASKGSPTLQTAQDMVNTGAAKNIQEAMRKLTKQSTMADTLGAIVAKGGNVGADEVEIALRIQYPDVIPNKKIKGSNKVYKEWKNKNEGKTEMDFMIEVVSKGSDFGPGVYIIDKRAIVVDDQDNMAYEW